MEFMTTEEKRAIVKDILGITDDSEDFRITTFLSVAGREILSWRYSYSGSGSVTSVPAEYEMTQIYAVVAGYSQSGAENQKQHTENGIGRVFSYTDMIQYIRANVIPLCKLV